MSPYIKTVYSFIIMQKNMPFTKLSKLQASEISQEELKVQSYWKTTKIFEKTNEVRQDAKRFTYYDGPPFATGLPHYGHILAGTIKDVVCRYKLMQGYYVDRRFGWDCHGLPVESLVEKKFNVHGSQIPTEMGIDIFNEECRKVVFQCEDDWKATISRMGRWVDFERTYRTMDSSFMESVWWVFGQLFEKGLIYEGLKVMPFSTNLGTPLSNFEASLNYKEVDDPSIIIKFALRDEPDTFFLAWTTTPWTLISNLALTVSPSLEYLKIQDKQSGKFLVCAKARLKSLYKQEEDYEVIDSYMGKELEGKSYEPLFDYIAEQATENAYKVICADFVTLDEGTGIVHTAPAFGEDDFYACKNYGIDPVCPVDNSGCYTDGIGQWSGVYVKEADKLIVKDLKKRGLLFSQSTCRHRYPFCWRSDTPLIYRTVNTWFVAVEKIKDKLLASNEQIHWNPHHVKHQRFGKWLENARDWAISRNRFWGTPIPIWKSEDNDLLVIDSVAKLEELSGKKFNDIHRHFIDAEPIVYQGKTYYRIPEVFDCWFESGSMPYAQNHYPFENKEIVEQHFPADFISEGLDQTRGWFYTLTVLASALFEKPAFSNCNVFGIILAEDGQKMSKRLKNYPDPNVVFDQYGADALRLYLLDSPVVKGDDLCFSERGVDLVLKQLIIPFMNSYAFFSTYASIDEWKSHKKMEDVAKDCRQLDRWILSRLQSLKHGVNSSMDTYDLNGAVSPFVSFIQELTNWYIRRSRKLFWSSGMSEDKDNAYHILEHVLKELCQVAAPFVPFIAESIYQRLPSTNKESVHLTDYPTMDKAFVDKDLESQMAAVQVVASLGHSLRKEQQLKVRQPLASIFIASSDQNTLKWLEMNQKLICDELNVKKVEITENEDEFIHLSIRPNFRVLGKKVKSKMRQIQEVINSLDKEHILMLKNNSQIPVSCDGEEIFLQPEDVEIARQVKEGCVAATQGLISIALDTELSHELMLEGLARELVNKVNTYRKELGFEVTDRISICLTSTDLVDQMLKNHSDLVQREVLAVSIDTQITEGIEMNLNGEIIQIQLVKV